MKKNMKGINAKVNAVIRKNPNATPAEMDKALKALAKEMGISHQSVSNWRNENGPPRNYRKKETTVRPAGEDAGGASPSPTNKNGGESK